MGRGTGRGRLEGRIAVVTGAGAGIGLAIARLFAAEGARVFVSDIDTDKARSAADAVTGAGGEAIPIAADVTKAQEVAALFEAIGAAHGRLDILVNSAGVSGRSDFRTMEEAAWNRVLDVNLNGTMRCMRAGFELLKASGQGAIVNLSSIMAHKHTRQMSNYSASKGAVSALSRAVALEYAPFQIRVNYLCPGWVETALTRRYTANPFIARGLLQQTPMARFGRPEEVARAALFLASDEASFITGTGLNVDGGMSVML